MNGWIGGSCWFEFSFVKSNPISSVISWIVLPLNDIFLVFSQSSSKSKIKFWRQTNESREVVLMTLTEAIPGVVKLGNLAGEHNIKLSDLNLPRPEQFKFVSRFSGIDSLLVVDLISCEMPRFLPRCIHNFQRRTKVKAPTTLRIKRLSLDKVV